MTAEDRTHSWAEGDDCSRWSAFAEFLTRFLKAIKFGYYIQTKCMISSNIISSTADVCISCYFICLMRETFYFYVFTYISDWSEQITCVNIVSVLLVTWLCMSTWISQLWDVHHFLDHVLQPVCLRGQGSTFLCNLIWACSALVYGTGLGLHHHLIVQMRERNKFPIPSNAIFSDGSRCLSSNNALRKVTLAACPMGKVT